MFLHRLDTPASAVERKLFPGHIAAGTGMVQPRNWTSSMTGWASGTTRESRPWADNDYTEIQ
ncbi:hypothetical protein PV682_31835 [Streptomyces niveiscabiei]|nr:hypothetical protein [Streptomyces niveiscabiei]